MVILGANLEIKPSRAEQMKNVIANSKMLLCQYEIPFNTLKRAFEIAKESDGQCFLKNSVGQFWLLRNRFKTFTTSCAGLIELYAMPCCSWSRKIDLMKRQLALYESAYLSDARGLRGSENYFCCVQCERATNGSVFWFNPLKYGETIDRGSAMVFEVIQPGLRKTTFRQFA